MKKRIARLSAFVRSHSRRVFVPERCELAERLARLSTWRPWPAAKSAHRCAFSGMCMGKDLRLKDTQTQWHEVTEARRYRGTKAHRKNPESLRGVVFSASL